MLIVLRISELPASLHDIARVELIRSVLHRRTDDKSFLGQAEPEQPCSRLNWRANNLCPVVPEQLRHAFRGGHSSSILPKLRQFAKELLDRPGWL